MTTSPYIRLLTDVKLNDIQKYTWYKAVDTFLGETHSPRQENFIDSPITQQPELKGTDEFPHVYIVYLSKKPDLIRSEQIVVLWNEIYPRNFEIESSTQCDCPKNNCSCQVEIDDETFLEIQNHASKFFHNRWVEDKIHEGWRFGLLESSKDKTSPRLRDWDSLQDEYRKKMPMTQEQAIGFFKRNRFLFV